MRNILIFFTLFVSLSLQAQNYNALIEEGMNAIVNEEYTIAISKFKTGRKLAKKAKNKDQQLQFQSYLTKAEKYLEFVNRKHSITALTNSGLHQQASNAKSSAYFALRSATSISHPITDAFDQQQLQVFGEVANAADAQRQESMEDLLREAKQSFAAKEYKQAIDQFKSALNAFSGSEYDRQNIEDDLKEAELNFTLREAESALFDKEYEKAFSLLQEAKRTNKSPLIDEKIKEAKDAICSSSSTNLAQLVNLDIKEIKRLQIDLPKYGCDLKYTNALAKAEGYSKAVDKAKTLESNDPKEALRYYNQAKNFYASNFVKNKIKNLNASLNPTAIAGTVSIEKGMEGWVDMHAHPMSHLAFGGKLLHGAPDVGTIMSVIPNDCSRKYQRANSIEEALGNCDNTHGGNDFGRAIAGNNCGDDKRKLLLSLVEGGMGAAQKHGEDGAFGYPDFNHWPAHNNLTHQQMYVDWIERCYKHGLRVMVGLSVNNATYSATFSGPGDENPDDKASSDIQIDEMKRMVSRHNWMEVAYSADDLKRIVKSGKMAMVLGIEVDNIGNFNKDETIDANNPSNAAKSKLKREIERLHRQGIRYIFPVHVVDNKLAGTAIYEPIFSVSNLHQTGEYWDVTCASPEDNIGFKYDGGFQVKEAGSRAILGMNPLQSPPPPSSCSHGHINNRALTTLGKYAIKEMMKLGMMIDVDHMSQKAVNESIQIATPYKYPLNSGHNGIRTYSSNSNHPSNERNFTIDQYKKIYNLGGMAGIGMAGLDAKKFEQQTNLFKNALGKNVALALGTDANGMEPLPAPRRGSNVRYNYEFPKSKLGNQFWDYNELGVAHYGLFADFLKDVESFNAPLVNTNLKSGASYFAQMWKKCETQSASVRN